MGCFPATIKNKKKLNVQLLIKKKEADGSASFGIRENYARSTFPDFKHLAQTYCVFVPPFTLQRTDLMFDLNILFDLL
jgi:hypothetical protein